MSVELKEYIERIIDERQKQTDIRLEAAAAAFAKADQYAQKEAVDARLEELYQRVSTIEGNRIGLTVLVGWALTVLGLLGAVTALLLK